MELKEQKDIEAFLSTNKKNGDVSQEKTIYTIKMFFDGGGTKCSSISSYVIQNVHLKELFSEYVNVLKLFVLFL